MKWRATHEITVPGPTSRLVIPVMLDRGYLAQRSEFERRFHPVWQLEDGKPVLLGGTPAGATLRQLGRGSHPRRGKPATARLTVHLTPEEHAAVTAAAERAGRKASAWAAPILIAAAKP